MRYPLLVCSWLGCFLVCAGMASAQSLPRSIPEREGVSSAAINRFIDSLSASTEPHSIMLLRHGKVIAEQWWYPYRADQLHNMYSVSKSFTSTAVGFAVDDHLLQLSDKVTGFFPDALPDTLSENLKALTVKDLLTMSVGMDDVPKGELAKDFLAFPINHPPGTRFLYNPMATYTLSAIVQRVTKRNLLDYLNEKLLQPIGIKDADWTESPEHVVSGGWGLRLTTEDMARFGQFYLQQGAWSGKQLLSRAWVQQATSPQIIQHPQKSAEAREASDSEQGYGFQFWNGLHHSYRADGSWGQFILVMPEQDTVLAITEEAADPQKILNLVWSTLLPGMQDQPLPPVPRTKNTLVLPVKTSALNRTVNDRFTVDANDIKISALQIGCTQNHCTLSVTKAGRDFQFQFGRGKWITGTTNIRGISHPADFFDKLKDKKPSTVAGTFYWSDPRTLTLTLQYTQSQFMEFVGRETLTFNFDGNKLHAELNDNRGWKVNISATGMPGSPRDH